MTKTNTSTLLSIGFFIAGALLLLPLLSGDLLYMAQSRSLFMSGSQFWHDCMRHAGGGLEWLGLALTQLGYYPWLCGWALVLIWLATLWLLRRIFPLPATMAMATFYPTCSHADLSHCPGLLGLLPQTARLHLPS